MLCCGSVAGRPRVGIYMTFWGFKRTAVSEESFAPVNSAIFEDVAA